MANLLRDIGTLNELQAWSERLEVAKQLAKGLSYREVARHTGASTTTVTRVARFIENGLGGYRKFLKVHRHHRMKPQSVTHPDSAPFPSHPAAAHAVLPQGAALLQKYLSKKEELLSPDEKDQ